MVEVIKDSIDGYYDENLGAYIDSKKKRNKLMKQKGLAFAKDFEGHKPKKKTIGKEHLPTRDQVQKLIMDLKYRKGGKLVR